MPVVSYRYGILLIGTSPYLWWFKCIPGVLPCALVFIGMLQKIYKNQGRQNLLAGYSAITTAICFVVLQYDFCSPYLLMTKTMVMNRFSEELNVLRF